MVKPKYTDDTKNFVYQMKNIFLIEKMTISSWVEWFNYTLISSTQLQTVVSWTWTLVFKCPEYCLLK